jgi:adenylate kinase
MTSQVREHMATALYERVLLADHPEAEALVLENAWTGDGAAEAASELVRLLTI